MEKNNGLEKPISKLHLRVLSCSGHVASGANHVGQMAVPTSILQVNQLKIKIMSNLVMLRQ